MYQNLLFRFYHCSSSFFFYSLLSFYFQKEKKNVFYVLSSIKGKVLFYLYAENRLMFMNNNR